MKFTYRHTRYACYLASITQAIVVNLAPLLFVTFQKTYGLSLEKIALLISVNFGTQILTDLAVIKLVDRIGFRLPSVVAHILATLGLFMLGILPQIMEPFAGLCVAMVVVAVGGGLIEVVNSPILETLPGDEKAAAMSLMHSFYCWGQVSVILGSTLFFLTAGIERFRVLPFLWAIVPALNMILFLKVPIGRLVSAKDRQRLSEILKNPVLWLMFLLIVCSGAAEQAMAQWSSLFAEIGLGVSKTMGDLLGPCAFATLMGLGRLFYGLNGGKIKLKRALLFSAGLCVFSYALAVFAKLPVFSLIGCALCGLSVSLMWPGVLSMSSSLCPRGGGAMFGMLALLGDVGCAVGPMLVGVVSGRVAQGGLGFATRLFGEADLTRTGLHTGLLFAAVFPVVMLLGVALLGKKGVAHKRNSEETGDV